MTKGNVKLMKLTRIAAGTASLALVAGATLLGAAPASAAEIDVTIPNPIPAENPLGYDPFWFAGDVTAGDGSAIQDATGLVIDGGNTGFQLLNGAAEDNAALTLSAALEFPAVSDADGEAFFQIAVFGEPNAEFTTLRPVDANDLSGDWIVSQAVAGLLVGTPYTADELITALDSGAPAKVLAFGVFVDPGNTVTLRGITFNGDNYLFAASPTLTVAPTSLQLSERSKPATLSATGFLPGEDVYIGYGGGGFGGLLDVVTADANGSVTYVVDVSAFELGDYTFGVGDEGGVLSAQAAFSIVANVLPATGVELTGGLVGAGALLAAGGVFLVLRRRASLTA
jgi:LPXTG-motif cell wall-anchored protein